MFVQIVLPKLDIQKQIQNRDNAFYWSACIESVLRRNRIINVETIADDNNFVIDSKALSLFARGAEPGNPIQTGFFEGPRSKQELSCYGLVSHYHEVEQLHLYDEQRNYVGELAYQSCLVRRIPKSKHEESKPYLNRTKDQRWGNRKIRFQTFKDTTGWTPLLWVQIGEEWVSVALKRGSIVIIGIPLFDLLAAAYAFPPLDAGYYQMVTTPPNIEVEECFNKILKNLAIEISTPIVEISPWPNNKQFALTIRHDCDRPITFKEMLGLLLFYRKHGVKASFGILKNQLPFMQNILVKLFGHEINLHSVSSSVAEMADERRTLESLTGNKIFGFHSHGGAGSSGFLGDHHYAWAEETGFNYVEMLGRSTRQPHTINRVVDELPSMTKLVAPAVHYSFDAGMGLEQLYYDHILSSLARTRGKQEHMVIMNHPDIHLYDLKKLIEIICKYDVWFATLEDVVDWYRSTRSEVKVNVTTSGYKIKFMVKIEGDLLINTFHGSNSSHRVIAESIAYEVRI
jgi:hypothetical protein